MDDATAAGSATSTDEDAGAGESTAEDSAPQDKATQSTKDTVSQDAKTDSKETEKETSEKKPTDSPSKEDKAKTSEEKTEATSEEKEEKGVRFDKHPAWQRMQRKNRTLLERTNAQAKSLTEVLSLLEKVHASQTGEKAKVVTPATVNVNKDDVLDNEVEHLIEELEKDGKELSEQDEAKLIKLAKELQFKVGEEEAYIPASILYQIQQKLAGVTESESTTEAAKDGKAAKVSKKPSGGVNEGKVTDFIRADLKGQSLDQIMHRAKIMAQAIP